MIINNTIKEWQLLLKKGIKEITINGFKDPAVAITYINRGDFKTDKDPIVTRIELGKYEVY